jgi:two-component system nitrogen regulation sensor histidine kinase NtrY
MPDRMPDLSLDPEQVKRVLINLFDNSINAMDANGEIMVTGVFNGSGDKIILEIADNGKGVDEKDMDKLFLPYFSTKKDGTGLGLAISHMIISKHGGTISASNNTPRGARFTIEFPA